VPLQRSQAKGQSFICLPVPKKFSFPAMPFKPILSQSKTWASQTS
jgi:hypothetical protein